jgi:protein gp37
MALSTGIEWTESTWNPVFGCDKISPGCKFCYAEVLAERFRGGLGVYKSGFDIKLVPEKLHDPIHWKKSRSIFVNSMSDLFHPFVPSSYIIQVAEVMMQANWHRYQILTKRSDRMRDLLNTDLAFAAKASHIWWGVSVEDKQYGLPRVDHLRDSNVSNRFLSIEPLLEDLGTFSLEGIHWVIVGGESGHGSRPMAKDWVLSIRDQCAVASVPFFFKQWGGVHKKEGGHLLDGVEYWHYPSGLKKVG